MHAWGRLTRRMHWKHDNTFLLFEHLFFSAYFGVAILPWVYFFYLFSLKIS